MLGKAHWHLLWVDGKRAFPHHTIRRWAHIWATGALYKKTEASQHRLLPCLGHCGTHHHVRCTDSSSCGLGSPPSFILKCELKATPEQPAPHARGTLSMWRSLAVTLRGLCPGNIAAHWMQLRGHQHSELPANQGDTSTLVPSCLSKWQHPSRPFEELIWSVRHFCAWEKTSVPGSLGARSAASSQHWAPSSLSPFAAAFSQALQHQEPGCGRGLDRRAWGGSYYLHGTMGPVSHEFKASILTEIRQLNLYLVPKSKRFARGAAMSQWQGEEGSQAPLEASTCPC